jgi:hypothetical protein
VVYNTFFPHIYDLYNILDNQGGKQYAILAQNRENFLSQIAHSERFATLLPCARDEAIIAYKSARMMLHRC